MIAHPLTLTGKVVRLEPLEREHIGALMAIATTSPEQFQYTSTPVNDEQREAYFTKAFRMREEGTAYAFVIRHLPSGRVVGSSRYSDILWHYRNCELGYTWIDPSLQGSAVNSESKLLMLGYAFETLDFVRVQIHTDVRNRQSQEAIRALGAVYEGVLRNHMINKQGYVRDTMVFSVIDRDWPRVKRQLEARVEAKLTHSDTSSST